MDLKSSVHDFIIACRELIRDVEYSGQKKVFDLDQEIDALEKTVSEYAFFSTSRAAELIFSLKA